jgi:hypothetical protein
MTAASRTAAGIRTEPRAAPRKAEFVGVLEAPVEAAAVVVEERVVEDAAVPFNLCAFC